VQGRKNAVPEWPPDLFAFAATVVDRHGVYAEMEFSGGWDQRAYAFKPAFGARVSRAAAAWAKDMEPQADVQRAWNRLIGKARRPAKWNWKRDVIFLLIVSDITCRGVDGEHPDKADNFLYADVIFEDLRLFHEKKGGHFLPYLPKSMCWQVPPSFCCVQPKTNTPSVGCTLRSLSHHLALLPTDGVVETSWLVAAPDKTPSDQFNMLLIPFPFHIPANDFVPNLSSAGKDHCFFSVRQSWLMHNGRAVGINAIANFIVTMIDEAEREADRVHAVVLPELSLDGKLVERIAKAVGKRRKNLELFVAGVLDDLGGGHFHNSAFTACFLDGEMSYYWRQVKHHRWKLDQSQISRYNLGYSLRPDQSWWEQIDVSKRRCSFTVIRSGASLATLVCEDLARFDPVLPVINSIGPTLLVALLMDGPQWERRWPGRYATVLADDPGTSVLTLTSLGMINRSTQTGQTPARQIALWKESGADTRELSLPQGEHGLILSLSMRQRDRAPLDKRVQPGRTSSFSLSGSRSVRIRDPAFFNRFSFD
jgi:hypothetical protein